MGKKKEIFVIGHKNPDTDSICSAIAYANLKNIIAEKNGEEKYIPKRAGEINNETKYVLDYFGLESPQFMSYAGTQVQDIAIRVTSSLTKDMSLKKAWNTMRDLQEATMPIVEEGKMTGLLSVKDIATANLDLDETNILSMSKTSFKNILDTIDGTIIVGDENGVVPPGGKLIVGAANPDLLESYVEKGDVLLTGNRFETQICGVEMDASCIIVSMGTSVSKTIQKLAKEKGCVIISTPHDTYMTARLINQSIPIGYFMRKEDLITFRMDDYITDIRETLSQIRHRDFPVLDKEGNYCGMLSRRSLLDMDKKKIIMVDHNEKSQAVDGIDEAEIVEIIDHHRLGTMETTMPIYFRNQPVGCTATIVYQMYQENGVNVEPKIAGLLCSAILSDTLMFRSPTCTPMDKKAAEALAKIADITIEDYATNMFRAGSSLSDKTPEEIFYQDFKTFNSDNINFGVGQISSLDAGELDTLRPRIAGFMAAADKKETQMLFFLLTNIIEESSDLVFFGENAQVIAEAAFGQKATDNYIHLPGVVSRKKQFVPRILSAIQQ